jgi:hypothetical protein
MTMEVLSSGSILLCLTLIEMYIIVSLLSCIIDALLKCVTKLITRDQPRQILVLGPNVNSGSAQNYIPTSKEAFYEYISTRMETVSKESGHYVFKVTFNPEANIGSLTVSRGLPPSNAQEFDNSCVVCLDKPPTHAFIPCGHMVCCEECVSRLTQCPMCRAQVSNRLKVYRQ